MLLKTQVVNDMSQVVGGEKTYPPTYHTLPTTYEWVAGWEELGASWLINSHF
jgi:hypothetical protein